MPENLSENICYGWAIRFLDDNREIEPYQKNVMQNLPNLMHPGGGWRSPQSFGPELGLNVLIWAVWYTTHPGIIFEAHSESALTD